MEPLVRTEFELGHNAVDLTYDAPNHKLVVVAHGHNNGWWVNVKHIGSNPNPAELNLGDERALMLAKIIGDADNYMRHRYKIPRLYKKAQTVYDE